MGEFHTKLMDSRDFLSTFLENVFHKMKLQHILIIEKQYS